MSDQEHGIKFYGRRKGKPMRSNKLDAYEQILPAITIKAPSSPVQAAQFFDFPVRETWMEIGFGDGEHLLHHAIQNPDIGMIGCEPFINGIAALCVGIRKHNLKNIRIWPEDARKLLPLIADHSVDRCFLLNSDPWPKTRHHKRRFIQQETLDDIHRLLKPGANFRMSSDHPSLVSWQLEKAFFHGGFEWMANNADDWRRRPDDLPETRYQNKGLKQGRPTVFLDFSARQK